jgi:hypothetical protein
MSTENATLPFTGAKRQRLAAPYLTLARAEGEAKRAVLRLAGQKPTEPR